METRSSSRKRALSLTAFSLRSGRCGIRRRGRPAHAGSGGAGRRGQQPRDPPVGTAGVGSGCGMRRRPVRVGPPRYTSRATGSGRRGGSARTGGGGTEPYDKWDPLVWTDGKKKGRSRTDLLGVFGYHLSHRIITKLIVQMEFNSPDKSIKEFNS
ncbi:hypothetical protein SEVIR_7G162600v4 [Setaria viridis]|uniref:Uncharacterized protein n=1 Tax=Setaria viridis TaxID=4556 RepID=A0A4U6TT47_SETVI|nr:hypothetical protein SEVIR_7G162600v2 [Setaria viridis]